MDKSAFIIVVCSDEVEILGFGPQMSQWEFPSNRFFPKDFDRQITTRDMREPQQLFFLRTARWNVQKFPQSLREISLSVHFECVKYLGKFPLSVSGSPSAPTRWFSKKIENVSSQLVSLKHLTEISPSTYRKFPQELTGNSCTVSACGNFP